MKRMVNRVLARLCNVLNRHYSRRHRGGSRPEGVHGRSNCQRQCGDSGGGSADCGRAASCVFTDPPRGTGCRESQSLSSRDGCPLGHEPHRYGFCSTPPDQRNTTSANDFAVNDFGNGNRSDEQQFDAAQFSNQQTYQQNTYGGSPNNQSQVQAVAAQFDDQDSNAPNDFAGASIPLRTAVEPVEMELPPITPPSEYSPAARVGTASTIFARCGKFVQRICNPSERDRKRRTRRESLLSGFRHATDSARRTPRGRGIARYHNPQSLVCTAQQHGPHGESRRCR